MELNKRHLLKNIHVFKSKSHMKYVLSNFKIFTNFLMIDRKFLLMQNFNNHSATCFATFTYCDSVHLLILILTHSRASLFYRNLKSRDKKSLQSQ